MIQSSSLSPTPGSLFVNRKSSFRTKINDFCHYKLEKQSITDGYSSLPTKRRTTMNVTFNTFRNEIDPYVHALNWLPQFKNQCRGYLARKRTEELRKKHEAVRIIQRAASHFLNPLVQIFHTIRPTLNIIKLDELKKYLRECIIQIKKLNAERLFIENQLDDVETTLDKSLSINNRNCLSLEGRKSPNIFGKISEIKANANNDTFLKECLDLNIEGLDDIEINFDTSSCENSKIHAVYEKSDKLQLKIHENQHKFQELMIRCESLEKEIKDLRDSNVSLDSASRLMKGILTKNDSEKEIQAKKLSEYEELLKKYNEDKRQNLTMLRESENLIQEKTEMLEELVSKCNYLDSELEKKIKDYNALKQEKLNGEKYIKELEETINYSNEVQQELESNLEIQKSRMKDMKKRFLEQIKNTEEDLFSEKNATKSHVQELNEHIESLMETIKLNESKIWKLEHEIKDSKEKDASDDDLSLNQEQSRKLNQQLKNSLATVESLQEEMKIMENNYEDMKMKKSILEGNMEIANQQETEYKKQIERLKSQIQSLKSAFNETELKLNRANREKNYMNQKWIQSRELNSQLENEISKLKEELNTSSQILNTKSKDIETLEIEFCSLKKEFEFKISGFDRLQDDSQTELNTTHEKLHHVQEEMKRTVENYKQELEEYKQLLDEREMEQENTVMENLQLNQTIKKLQKRIEEQDEVQTELEKTITKLKDENKNLKEDFGSQNIISVSDYRTRDLCSRDSPVSRSHSSITSPSPISSHSGFFTLPGRGVSKHQS